MLKSGYRRVGVIALAAMVLAGMAAPVAAQDDLREITVVLPHPGAIGHFPMHVAIGEGYFAEEGLKVNVTAVDGSGQVVQAIAAGQGDIGVPGPGPLLSARAQGVDVVSFYNHFTKSQFGILVGQDSEYQSLTDLSGKIIGVGTADGAEVSFARSMLDAAGMVEGTDYTFLPVGDSGPAAVAFLRGEIEAYAAATADAAILSMRGMDVRDITPPEFQGYFGNGFMALRSFIDANPEVMEGFGRALARGSVFGQDPANHDKVLEYVAIGNPQESEDRELAEALFANMKQRVLPTDISLGWGYNHPEQWAAWEASLVNSGDLDAPAGNLSDAYTNAFVAAWNEGLAQ